MKIYKGIMRVITVIENAVLAVSMLLVLVLTFGNVVARKVFNHSWGFTDEIVVAVFVLISLLAAGVAAALAAKKGIAPRALPVAELQAALRAQNVYLG